MEFRIDPIRFVTGDEKARAVASLKSYFARYTGSRFESLADTASPNRITPSDLASVSMLGVNVPPNAAIWILKSGADEIERLLTLMLQEHAIWSSEANIMPDGPAWQLWNYLRQHRWPEGKKASGLGPTKTSKLLAAKRPHLIPIYDQHVADALLNDPDKDNLWDLWQSRLRGPDGEKAQEAAKSVAKAAGIGNRLSILRIFDVVVWMRVHGWQWDKEHLAADFESAPRFWQR